MALYLLRNSAWFLKMRAGLPAPVRCKEIQIGINRDDPVRVDGLVAVMVVPDDVLEVHRLGIWKSSRVYPQMFG